MIPARYRYPKSWTPNEKRRFRYWKRTRPERAEMRAMFDRLEPLVRASDSKDEVDKLMAGWWLYIAGDHQSWGGTTTDNGRSLRRMARRYGVLESATP